MRRRLDAPNLHDSMSDPSDHPLSEDGLDKVRSDLRASFRQTAEALERTERLLLAMAVLRPHPLALSARDAALQPIVEMTPEMGLGPPSEVARTEDSARGIQDGGLAPATS